MRPLLCLLLCVLMHSPMAKSQQGTTLLQGRYRVLVEDYAHRPARTRHYLMTRRGPQELALPAGAQLLASPGAPLRVSGKLQGQALRVAPQFLALAAPPLPDAMGGQTVAVILVKFQDDPAEPITPRAAHDLVFGQVNDFYRASSFDQAWLTGQVFGWITVPYPRAACTDAMLVSANADQQLIAQGVPLASYRRKVYLWPRNGCAWTGLALVGENPSMAWVNGAFNLKAIGHELGHGFGLRHAHAMECDPSPVGENCSISPYGDVADLMGNLRAGDFSPYAKERLGWLGDGVSPDILHADRSGRYTIQAYAGAGVGPRAIRIPRGISPTGALREFYLSFRSPVGLDGVLSGSGNWSRGVMVHAVDHGDGDSIHQLDMTPTAGTLGFADLNDGALEPGRTFVDPASGISVSVAALEADQAVVEVAYPAPPPPPSCPFLAPSLSWSVLPAAKAGEEMRATVVVKNNQSPDNAACSVQSLSLSLSVPSRWSGSIAPLAMVLSPGASASVQVAIKSPPGETPGQYALSLLATATTGQQSQADARATILPACSQSVPRFILRPIAPSGSGLGFLLGISSPQALACNASTQSTNGSNLHTPADVYQDLIQGWKAPARTKARRLRASRTGR